ncbi:hypothetical protein [Kitasatospora sp. NPDC001132]
MDPAHVPALFDPATGGYQKPIGRLSEPQGKIRRASEEVGTEADKRVSMVKGIPNNLGKTVKSLSQDGAGADATQALLAVTVTAVHAVYKYKLRRNGRIG